MHTIELNNYQAVNLMAAMVFISNLGGDTGDWHAEILHKLVELKVDIDMAPVKSPHEQRRELALRVGWEILDF